MPPGASSPESLLQGRLDGALEPERGGERGARTHWPGAAQASNPLPEANSRPPPPCGGSHPCQALSNTHRLLVPSASPEACESSSHTRVRKGRRRHPTRLPQQLRAAEDALGAESLQLFC